MRKPSNSSLVKFGLLLALIVGAVTFRFCTDAGRDITFQAIRDYVSTFPALLVPLLYIGIYVVGTVLFFPGVALSRRLCTPGSARRWAPRWRSCSPACSGAISSHSFWPAVCKRWTSD